MRFISKSAKFSLQIRPQIVEAYAAGMSKVTQPPLYADFQVGRLTDEEYQFALTQFSFEGGFQNQDEVTMIDPRYRLSLFDSDEEAERLGWTADEKEWVEQKLIQHSMTFTDVVRMPEKVIPPPWPNYDEYKAPADALVRKLVDEGYDLDEVLAYERANQNRQPVIDGIQQALDEIYEGEVVEEVVG